MRPPGRVGTWCLHRPRPPYVGAYRPKKRGSGNFVRRKAKTGAVRDQLRLPWSGADRPTPVAPKPLQVNSAKAREQGVRITISTADQPPSQSYTKTETYVRGRAKGEGPLWVKSGLSSQRHSMTAFPRKRTPPWYRFQRGIKNCCLFALSSARVTSRTHPLPACTAIAKDHSPAVTL